MTALTWSPTLYDLIKTEKNLEKATTNAITKVVTEKQPKIDVRKYCWL